MMGVHQVNIRAYFKKVYDISSSGENDGLMVLGIISCFSLPLIGIFNELS